MSTKKEAATKENAAKPEEKQVEEKPAEDVVKAEAKSPEPRPEASEKKKGHPILWTLIILAGAAAAAWFTEPEKTKAFLTGLMPPQAEQESTPAEEPALPADEEAPAPEEAPVELEGTLVESLPGEDLTSPPASSEEVALLMDAMRSLEGEIRQLRSEQQELRRAQQQLQNAQLRSRLVWIANPANRLVQIEQAWKEIATIPTLNSDERQLAEDMYALAAKREAELASWQQHLNNWADSLNVKPAENIVPETDNRWLKWARDQFSIKPSMRSEEKENQSLSLQLRNVGQMIALEEFPDPDHWRVLRARLQLKASESDNKTIDLPEEFSAVRQDISHLRQQAREWLERI